MVGEQRINHDMGMIELQYARNIDKEAFSYMKTGFRVGFVSYA